ncbi:MAG: site-specific integrase [Deltaproteobacteria bacterium]|nr:site-specific integrase [Deltaproteobacteria bacterium]
MASIRKRGKLQWEARIRRKGMPVTCKTFETKFEAEKWAREIEAEMDRGVFVSRSEAESTTLSEALERYIVEYIPKLAHADKSERMARALQRRALAPKCLAAIRSKDIADFIRERESEEVSANTIRLDMALLSRLFNVAIGNWGMESLVNPVGRVAKPKLAPGRERRLEPGEEERLLAVATPELQTLIKLALETAMRREELVTLTWRQIDLGRRVVSLGAANAKNSEARSIPLSPRAIEILRALQAEQSTGLPAQGGRLFPFHPDAVTKAMARACKFAGIEGLHFHDLRHEATSRLFENTDLDIMEIRSITGHKSLQMLARYTHLRTDRLADRLAGMKRG